MYLVPNKISGNSITHFPAGDNEKPRLSGDSRGKTSCYFFEKSSLTFKILNKPCKVIRYILAIAVFDFHISTHSGSLIKLESNFILVATFIDQNRITFRIVLHRINLIAVHLAQVIRVTDSDGLEHRSLRGAILSLRKLIFRHAIFVKANDLFGTVFICIGFCVIFFAADFYSSAVHFVRQFFLFRKVHGRIVPNTFQCSLSILKQQVTCILAIVCLFCEHRMLLGLAVLSKGSFRVNIGAFAGQNHLSFARFCFIGIIIGHSSLNIELVRIVDLLRGLCILTLCHIRDFCLLGLSRSAASLTALIRVRCIRTGNRFNDFSVATITAIPAIATVAAACATAAMLVFQATLNVLGAVDILPLTGVTLPFVSVGGSSMISCWGLLAFLKAADTRPNASFTLKLPKRIRGWIPPDADRMYDDRYNGWYDDYDEDAYEDYGYDDGYEDYDEYEDYDDYDQFAEDWTQDRGGWEDLIDGPLWPEGEDPLADPPPACGRSDERRRRR